MHAASYLLFSEQHRKIGVTANDVDAHDAGAWCFVDVVVALAVNNCDNFYIGLVT